MLIKRQLNTKLSKRASQKIRRISMTSTLSIQNGHRVRDSFAKLKLGEPLTHRDFERLKRQLRRDKEASK